MEFEELELDKPITTTKLNQFKKKGINNVDDLILTFPRSYTDYSHAVTLRDAVSGDKVAMVVVVRDVVKRMGSRVPYVDIVCREEETRNQVIVRYFNMLYMYDRFIDCIDKTLVVCGKYSDTEYGKQIINPEVFTDDVENALHIYPVYRKIAGMSDEYFNNVMNAALLQYEPEEELSDRLRSNFNLIGKAELISSIHRPKTGEDIKQASKRLVFERLYKFASKMVEDASGINRVSTIRPTSLTKTNELIKVFPYDLTSDQKEVITSLITTAQEGKRINALIQGDVGSGKTICAFLLMFAMADNGYQSALMAPTGVLAKQHYEELKGYAEKLGFTTVYLGSELKASEKKQIYAQIKSGEADFVVGTHSVISDAVEFKNLGLTVADEEHKFGVVQRETLKKKAGEGVHSVSMSATPIPRTLAMTLYNGALDIYTIMQMPNGRKPVKTAVVKDDISIFRFMEKEISMGHQCYVVCPLITDSDTASDDEEPPVSVEEALNNINNYFGIRGIKAEAVTGKMKDEEKSIIIDRFKKNETQILVATTIIEVGVNVPNATVITIMNADRFGLAGLHQLRGRVGRSSLQSYCILKSDQDNNPRLEAMVSTTNGFEIAEADLKLRGTGDFLGTRQSGDDENIKLIMKYPTYYQRIKEYVEKNLGADKIEWQKGEQ